MPSALFKFLGFLFQSLGYSIFCIGELFMFGIFIVSILEELSRHKLSHSCRRALSYFAVAVGFSVAVFLSIRDTYPEVFRSALYASSSTTAPASISSNTHSTERISASSEPKSSNASPQDNESTFPSDEDSVPLTDGITGALSTPTWWTPKGHSYHFSRSCPSLSRSSHVYNGTLSDALDAGKTDPCNICAHG